MTPLASRSMALGTVIGLPVSTVTGRASKLADTDTEWLGISTGPLDASSAPAA